MPILYIAEKPSLAAVVASHIWPTGKVRKNKHCYDGGDTIVTWAYGHILGLSTPEGYGDQYKYWNRYPIFPDKWKLRCDPQKKEQFDAISDMLKKCDTVVNVGDPDREGQLLIDEILIYLGYKGNVKRLLLPGLDDVNVNRAFKNMKDNREMHNLYLAGLCREKADWLVGINLTRAYTVSARRYGYTDTYVVGRVKTATLALVVRREREIRNFKPQTFYLFHGTFMKDNVSFNAKFVPAENMNLPMDPEKRILSSEPLEKIKASLSGKPAKITFVEKKPEKKNPPLPHSLDTLQIVANKKYGYSPTVVLDAVQKMYERKFVTYPRSDCNYIPEAQFEDAHEILNVLRKIGFGPSVKANPTIKSACWNDKKVTAHNAIIPTVEAPHDLTDVEQNIYELIALNYCLQFYPPRLSNVTKFKVEVGGYTFAGSGREITDEGYTKVLREEVSTKKAKDGEEENKALPVLKEGDAVTTQGYKIKESKTTPPERFTEGTLLKAMANVYLYVDPKNPNRDKLKEVKGIGTPATRNRIIAELQGIRAKSAKAPAYMQLEKKKLVPTALGNFIIDNIDPVLTHPDTTAEMEYALAKIEQGEYNPDTYIKEVQAFVTKNIDYAEHHQFPVSEDLVLCPVCKKGRLNRVYSKKTKKYFFICSNKECCHPVTKKPIFYRMGNDDKPDVRMCPSCHEAPLIYHDGKFGEYWTCDSCNKTFTPKGKGKDLNERRKLQTEPTEYPCPICKTGHLEKYKDKMGSYIYRCENRCKDPNSKSDFPMTYHEHDGKPDIQRCPICNELVSFFLGQYGPCWHCNKCNKFFPDDNGVPQLKKEGTGKTHFSSTKKGGSKKGFARSRGSK